jgi:hypothetical protein
MFLLDARQDFALYFKTMFFLVGFGFLDTKLCLMFLLDVRLCGASILTERYILTAAHCTQGATKVRVLLGIHNLDLDQVTPF